MNRLPVSFDPILLALNPMIQSNAPVSGESVWASQVVDPQRFDERIGEGGVVRRHWQDLSNWVEEYGADRLVEFADSITQTIRENGITFHADASDGIAGRPWQLSALPFLIDGGQWAGLEQDLAQRSRLLNAVLGDLLGPQALVRQGIIPGELLWANPNFRRAYCGLNGSLQKLHVVATDLIRDVSGEWLVAGDRTRAPSGLGYLLENRIVSSRVMSRMIRGCNTFRLAGFFESLREHLNSLAPSQRDNPRIALLTPPSGSYREFEDTYLARYLGMTLIRGSDLAVRGGGIHLKTLGGLKPIQVLWRHVSDRNCDPLELHPSSIEGVTGMLRCIRNGNVAVVNSVGSVLAETPALMPYLDAANQFFFGQSLSLPSIETFWCGDPKHLSHVLSNLDAYVFRSAMAVDRERPIVVEGMSQSDRESLIAKLRSTPALFVAQERVRFATTPVWTRGRVLSQKAVLRNFQLLRGDTVNVLPGALSRVGDDELELLRSPVSGQMTQDCWVANEHAVDQHKTLLPSENTTIELRRGGDELPSRVAEHLYWLGRYAERAECLARVLRTTLKRISGEDNWEALADVRRLVYALASMGQIEPGFAVDSFAGNLPEVEKSLPSSILDRDQPRGLVRTMEAALNNATTVRDRLSTDAYRIIQRAFFELNRPTAFATRSAQAERPDSFFTYGEAIERVGTVVVDLLAFAGVINEGFVRTHAWQFLELGRRIERADQTCDLLRTMMCPFSEEIDSVSESLLEITDSLMIYRSRYLSLVRLAPVIDLVVTDESNPRSVRFQLDQIAALMDELPTLGKTVGLDQIERIVKDLQYRVTVADPYQLCKPSEDGTLDELSELTVAINEELPKLSEAITAKYLIHTKTQLLTGTGR